MKIFVIPNYHKSIVQGTSQAVVQSRYIKLLEQHHDVTVLYPKWGDEINKVIGAKNYVCLDIEGYSNLSVLPKEYTDYLSKQDINNSIIYSFQSDIIIDLQAQLSQPPFKFPKVIHHFIANRDYGLKEAKNLKRMAGLYVAPLIVNSKYTKTILKEDFTKLGWVGSQIFADTRAVNLGIPFDDMKPHLNNAKYPDFTFLFPGNYLMGFKHVEKQLEVFDALYKMGHKFKVKFFLVDKFLNDERLKKPYIEVAPTLKREEFWAEANKCHAFLSTSDIESYGIAYWELCEAGCVGLFINRDWVRSIGAIDERYLCDGVSDMIQRASVLLMKNYQMESEMFRKMWESCRVSHEAKVCEDVYLRIVEQEIKQLMRK